MLLVGGQVVAWFTEKTFLRNFALGIVALTTALFGVFGILWAILILKGASIAVKVFLAGMSFSLLFTVLRLAWLAVQSQAHAAVILVIEIPTDTEGVDFGPFKLSVQQSVSRKCYERMPPSVKKGDIGTVLFQFRVQKDGKLPDGFMKVLSSTGKKEIDDASLKAIHDAAPFDHLPSKFSRPFVELRILFEYTHYDSRLGRYESLRTCPTDC